MTNNVLTIRSEDETPLVKALLLKLKESADLSVRQDEKIRTLEELIQILRDEIASLKKLSKRPKIKPNKKPKGPEGRIKGNDEKRPGSAKRSKELVIHETKFIKPENLPEGSKLKRCHPFDVQDIRLHIWNTRFMLEDWESPSGEIFSAKMPEGVAQGHFGNELCGYILNQYHQCQVTQPLLHEQLLELGVDISTGQINNLLIENKDLFHQEKSEILQSGLKVSSYIQVDDTGARHDGKTGYCTQIGNEFFAWFRSTSSKSRVNFLEILHSAYPDAGYTLNEDSFKYMQEAGLPNRPFEILKNSIKKHFDSKESWELWLKSCEIKCSRHIRIATEAALLAGAFQNGLNKDLIILSDDAGQFNIPLLKHALCWIHAERHIKKLIPLNDAMREAQQKAIDDFWVLYKRLKSYRTEPTHELAEAIKNEFDSLFSTKTAFESLNLIFKKILSQKDELLVVLDHPEVPLHNNGSETDIREYVKRRKVSGGTRSSSGQMCRDTFASIKKTCRKLGVSFYAYIKDRLTGAGKIEKLGILVEKAAKNNCNHIIKPAFGVSLAA